MFSPALQHRQRKLAELASGNASPVSGGAPMPTEGPVASEYQLMLAALQVDMNRLANIQSTADKVKAKREMICNYLPWVDGALAAEVPAQDEIVGNMLVWAIDIAAWDLAYRLAEHVLVHDLSMPERFKRKPATIIAEQVAEAGLIPVPTISREWLQRFDGLLEGRDMYDQVRAKLCKAIGFAFHAEAVAYDASADNAVAGGKAALLQATRDKFAAALALDKNAGVKKLVTQIDAELKKTAPAETCNDA